MAAVTHTRRRYKPRSAISSLSGRWSAASSTLKSSWTRRLSRVESTWVRVAVETVRHLLSHDATHMAAGVSYYAVLSLFPLSLVALSVFGFFFADSETAQEALTDFFETYLPQSTQLLTSNLSGVERFRGVLGIVGLAGMLWSGLAVMGAIMRSINRAFAIRDDRPFYRQKPLGLLVGVGVVVTFALSTAITTGVHLAFRFEFPLIGDSQVIRWLELQVAGRLLPALFSLATFTIIYRFLPNTQTRFRYILPGAVVGALLFEVGKVAFVFYLNEFANFQQVYGGIASVVILLVWFYYSALIIVIGAEVAAAYTRIREGLPPGAPAVIGERERRKLRRRWRRQTGRRRISDD